MAEELAGKDGKNKLYSHLFKMKVVIVSPHFTNLVKRIQIMPQPNAEAQDINPAMNLWALEKRKICYLIIRINFFFCNKF